MSGVKVTLTQEERELVAQWYWAAAEEGRGRGTGYEEDLCKESVLDATLEKLGIKKHYMDGGEAVGPDGMLR